MIRSRLQLLLDFTVRDIRGRYFGTLTGSLWALLHPAAQLALYGFVFGVVFKVKFPQLGDLDVVTFIALGMWPWLMFQDGVQRAMGSVPANLELMRKVAYPRELTPLASLAATFLIHGLGYVAVLVFLICTGKNLHWLGLPVVMLSTLSLMLAAVGLGLALAALHAVIRDIEHAAGPVFMLLFYATPILYPIEMVPSGLREWMGANPLAILFGRLRAGWLEGAALGATDLILLLAGLLLAWLGWRLYRRVAPFFEEFA